METIRPEQLKAIDTPSDGEVPSYDSTTNKFEWIVPASGGVGTSDHALLTHLAYADAAHTGFAGLAVSNTFTAGQVIDNPSVNIKLTFNTLNLSGYASSIAFNYGGTTFHEFGAMIVSGNKLFYIYDYGGRFPWLMYPSQGRMAINPPAYDFPSQLHVNVDPNIIGIIIQTGSDVQVQNMLEIRNVATTPVAYINAQGGLGVTTLAVTGNIGFFGAGLSAQSTGWSVSNASTDKSYDANATTVNELADVLGTLIDELKTKGLLGA